MSTVGPDRENATLATVLSMLATKIAELATTLDEAAIAAAEGQLNQTLGALGAFEGQAGDILALMRTLGVLRNEGWTMTSSAW